MNNQILDLLTFEAAVEQLPHGTFGLLSTRAALRALPVIKRLLDEDSETQAYALDSFRDLSTALFFALYDKPPKNSFTFNCKKQAAGPLRFLCENNQYFGYGYVAASYAVEDIMQFQYNKRNGVIWALKSNEIGANERLGFLEIRLWQEINIDSININGKFSAKELLETPLFKYGAIPGNPHWQPRDLLLALKHAGPHWDFWHDWYQGFLNGKPLDWDLQREVALIPDEDWDKGPEHIAVIIDPIRERYKLKEAVNEYEAILPKERTSRHGIGGNNPPLDVEYITSSEQIVSLSYTAINVLKDESEKETPDKTLIQKAVKALKIVLLAIATLGSAFFIGAAESAGSKYGEDVVKSVIERATSWYNHLP